MIFSWKNLGDKRLDVPGLGSVLVLEEVVRGAVAAQLHIQVKLLVKLFSAANFAPDDKKQEAGGIRVQLGEGQLAFQAVHSLAS